MSVTDNELANDVTFNGAFMSRDSDTSTTGRVDLQNALAASGPNVTNTQREINSLNSYTGRVAGSAYDVDPAWTAYEIGAATDSLFARIDELTSLFESTGGHTHDGAAGGGNPIAFTDLSGLTEGAIPFGDAGNNPDFDDTELFWDNTNKRLCLGDSVPATKIDVAGDVAIRQTTDSSTGNIDALTTTNISAIRLTGAAPALRGIAGGVDGKLLYIANASGVDVTVSNQHATPSAANRIITGTGADLTLANTASIVLQYDATTSRWRIVGGSGSGGGMWEVDTFTGNTLTTSVDAQQRWRYTGGSAQTATIDFSALVDDSEEIEILGTDDTNTVTIEAASDLIINGTWVGYRGSILRLRHDDGLAALVEVCRNGI